ncbi:MAG: hypothetical protein GEU83_14270 [Pseudonocardiaceae bacterium]|nr:hypothetical protein [Pseudonocardiaceae bacterium]
MNPRSVDSDTPPAAVVDVRVVLPDHWWVVPLQPQRARERSVDRLVERQFAGVDDQPLLRADTRRQLLSQADKAADSEARLMALSLLQIADIPVPASLVVHWIDVPPDPQSTLGDGALLLALRAELEPTPDATREPAFALDLAQLSAGKVLRRVYERDAELEGAEPTPSLVADYWLERPDGAGLVQLAFATPMVPLREPMLQLFDAIASALRWVTDEESR